MAYIEDFMNHLQAVVVASGQEEERRKQEIVALKEKVLQIAAVLEDVPSQKPPHY